MNTNYKRGFLVNPIQRINKQQIHSIHEASLSILDDPGITCFNEHAASLLNDAGCQVKPENSNKNSWKIRFPSKVVLEAVESIPREIILGARKPENRLILNTDVPKVYFGTGSETNIYQKTLLSQYVKKDDPSNVIYKPEYIEERGSIKKLCQSSKLCNTLQNVDFFIRNINIQDKEINPDNKDVNIFFASLMYMTKHVQAGLVTLEHLDDVLKLAGIIAGGEKKLKENPIISFITCLIKSPLQMVNDTAEKLITIAQKGIPVVISSSPQGGSTAPIKEEGMVTLINAEILAGITLGQIVNPGFPMLYGAVPVRARLDTLHDLYGAPEFIHYNIDCIQMAKHYGIPCYSSAGVGDAKVPGVQATVEKLFAQTEVAAAGAQYIHYAVGLLDKTNIFSPLQAVLDDAHLNIIKQVLRQPCFNKKEVENAIQEIRQVTSSKTKLFAKHIRKALREGLVSSPYPFETSDEEDKVLEKAYHQLQNLLKTPGEKLDDDLIKNIYKEIPGLLPREYFEINNI